MREDCASWRGLQRRDIVPEFAKAAKRIINNVEKGVLGREPAIKLVLAALLTEGHILIEDVPGVARQRVCACRSTVWEKGIDFCDAVVRQSGLNRGSLKFTCRFKARSRIEVGADRFPAPEVVALVVQYVAARPTAEELECSCLGGSEFCDDLRT
jgi:hypothetical protein